MEHTGGPSDVTSDKGKNVEATKENPINLEDDKEGNKDGKRRKKLTSPAWDHFTTLPNCTEGMEKAKCNYCKIIVSCNAFANVQYGVQSSSTTNANIGSSKNVDFRKYMEEQVQGGKGKSEIDIYLMDGIEMDDENFDILSWWKIHSTKFPVLSKIARHVLGLSISTVASESTFSTGGRTLDAYRSRLSPLTAEALICTQDWLRSVDTFTDLRQEPEDYKKYENIEKDEFKDAQNLFGECVIDE